MRRAAIASVLAVLRGPRRSRALSGKAADRLIESVRQALYASKIASYAQGFALLAAASLERRYELNLSEIARIWKGGCIIRARLLNEIQAAYTREPNRSNLLLDSEFREAISRRQAGWRHALQVARRFGIPCPATSASLDYYDSYRAARLPANLIQAQRDYFGAHTYERIDRPGVFHTEWLGSGGVHGPQDGSRVLTSDPVVAGVAVKAAQPTETPAPVSAR